MKLRFYGYTIEETGFCITVSYYGERIAEVSTIDQALKVIEERRGKKIGVADIKECVF